MHNNGERASPGCEIRLKGYTRPNDEHRRRYDSSLARSPHATKKARHAPAGSSAPRPPSPRGDPDDDLHGDSGRGIGLGRGSGCGSGSDSSESTMSSSATSRFTRSRASFSLALPGARLQQRARRVDGGHDRDLLDAGGGVSLAEFAHRAIDVGGRLHQLRLLVRMTGELHLLVEDAQLDQTALRVPRPVRLPARPPARLPARQPARFAQCPASIDFRRTIICSTLPRAVSFFSISRERSSGQRFLALQQRNGSRASDACRARSAPAPGSPSAASSSSREGRLIG